MFSTVDTMIEFTEYNSYRKYPEKLRLVKFYDDEEQGREFTFLTNDFYLTPAIIAYCLVAIVQHDLQLKRLTYENGLKCRRKRNLFCSVDFCL